jgi:hypothetical protein
MEDFHPLLPISFDLNGRYLDRAFCNLMTIGVHAYRLSNSIAVATIVGITQKTV